VGCSPDDVTIGMAVRVRWDDVSDTVTIPRFAPSPEGQFGPNVVAAAVTNFGDRMK
jgi:hypothetical protein